MGYRIIETMHTAAGQPSSFEAAPGHIFRGDELVEAIGMLLQPMIFGWDATFVPWWSSGSVDFFLHVSHDYYLTVVTRTKEFHDRVFALLKEHEFEPKAGTEKTVKRFCRTP